MVSLRLNKAVRLPCVTILFDWLKSFSSNAGLWLLSLDIMDFVRIAVRNAAEPARAAPILLLLLASLKRFAVTSSPFLSVNFPVSKSYL